MIIVLRIYEVHSVDSQAFIHSFDEEGPWHRISGRFAGHVHTDLLRRADLPAIFLVQEFWQSERYFTLAEHNAEARGFLQWLRTLAISHQSLGAFSFRGAWDSAWNCDDSFQMLAEFEGHEVRQ